MEKEEFKVIIPKEKFYTLTAQEDGLPAVMCVNGGICDFKPKVVFGWHLSILFTLVDTNESGLPSQEELDALYSWEDSIGSDIKGEDEHPNALLLGTCNWNRRRELMYRVNNPEMADSILKRVCDENSVPNAMHYEMCHDPEWEKAEYYLAPIKSQQKSGGNAS